MGTSRRLVPLCKQNAAHLHYLSLGGGGGVRGLKNTWVLNWVYEALKGMFICDSAN